jgi:hypothetical protein
VVALVHIYKHRPSFSHVSSPSLNASIESSLLFITSSIFAIAIVSENRRTLVLKALPSQCLTYKMTFLDLMSQEIAPSDVLIRISHVTLLCMSINMTTTQQVPPACGVPDNVIDALFGRGLSATDWQHELIAQGYKWIPGLRNIIIRREFYFFKSEIERLLAEPPTPTPNGGKSNSCKSVHRRIKGETGERGQRLHEGRLFGPEAS